MSSLEEELNHNFLFLGRFRQIHPTVALAHEIHISLYHCSWEYFLHLSSTIEFAKYEVKLRQHNDQESCSTTMITVSRDAFNNVRPESSGHVSLSRRTEISFRFRPPPHCQRPAGNDQFITDMSIISAYSSNTVLPGGPALQEPLTARLLRGVEVNKLTLARRRNINLKTWRP